MSIKCRGLICLLQKILMYSQAGQKLRKYEKHPHFQLTCCQLDVQILLRPVLWPFQHRCLLSVDFFFYNIYDGVVVLPYMLCPSHPFLIGIPVFLQSRLQAPFGPSNINQVTATQYTVYHYTLCTGSPMWYAVSLAAAELSLRKVLHIQMTPEDEHFNQNRGLQGLGKRQKGRDNYHPNFWHLISLLQYTLLHL